MGSVGSLEKLIAYLRHYIEQSEIALVESPKLLRDRSTGRLRKHDALLTIYSGSHPFLAAIECRERSRPAGLPRIEAFARKCSATSIHKPIMVSPCGFTSAALSRAKELGIHCLPFDEIETFPWLRCDTELHQVRIRYTHIDFALITASGLEKNPASCTLINDDGEVISPESLRDYLVAVLIRRQRSPSDMQPGDHVERIRLCPTNFSIMETTTGPRRKVLQINLVAHSLNEEQELPFLPQGSTDTMPETSAEHLSMLLEESCIGDAKISGHRNSN